jgi:hypothetical protein
VRGLEKGSIQAFPGRFREGPESAILPVDRIGKEEVGGDLPRNQWEQTLNPKTF